MKLLREVLSPDELPESLSFSEWDLLFQPSHAGVRIGCEALEGFGKAYDLTIWWPRGAMPPGAVLAIGAVTGLQKPGCARRAILWTSNPDHAVRRPETIAYQDARDIVKLLSFLHLIHQRPFVSCEAARKLWYDKGYVDALVDSTAYPEMCGVLLPSLTRAGFYRWFHGKK